MAPVSHCGPGRSVLPINPVGTHPLWSIPPSDLQFHESLFPDRVRRVVQGLKTEVEADQRSQRARAWVHVDSSTYKAASLIRGWQARSWETSLRDWVLVC